MKLCKLAQRTEFIIAQQTTYSCCDFYREIESRWGEIVDEFAVEKVNHSIAGFYML
jgi:hypothetical protein